MMVYTSFGIIHNCAKLEDNCKLLRKYHFLQAAKPYLVMKGNSTEVVLTAVLAVSYVMEENEAHIARLTDSKNY